MTAASNFAAMDAMLKTAGFQVPESMRAPALTPPSQATQEQMQQVSAAQQDLDKAFGQTQPQPGAVTAAAIDNLAAQPDANLGGLDSIRKGLEEKAAALEGQALAASQPALEEDRSFAKYDKGGKFEVPLLNMLQDAILGDKKETQGMDCSLADVTCQNVGTQQQSQGIAARR